MKTGYKALLLAVIAAACFWVLVSLLCFFVFYDEPFLDLLIFKVSSHHFFTRFACLLGLGALIVRPGVEKLKECRG